MRKMTIVLMLLLVGCGGGGGGKSSSPTTGGPTTSSVDADRARAERIVLTAADLPGYTEEKVADTSSQQTRRSLEACLQNDRTLTGDESTNPRKVKGKHFLKGDAFRVSTDATVAETEDQARTTVRRASDPSVPDCFAKGLTAAFTTSSEPGLTIQDFRVTRLDEPPAGDEVLGLRISFTARSQSDKAQGTLDLVLVRKDRALASVTTSGPRVPFPAAERIALVRKVADRMAA